MPASRPERPRRLLIVLPSWVGDAVMATPALRLLRDSLTGSFIGALARPGIDQLLAGSGLFDEVHVDRAQGVMATKRVASLLRPRRYDAALLLTNSFRSALEARLAGIPRRVGYDRDARALLLTQPLPAPQRPDGSWLPVPAAAYYWNAARRFLDPDAAGWHALPIGARLELAVTPDDDAKASDVRSRLGLAPRAPVAVLNPGANNEAKRWPADRFAPVARHLIDRHGLTVLVNGAPAEAALARAIAAAAGGDVLALPDAGITLGALKAILAGPHIDGRRHPARLMVTNDTGPRHIAAALGVPVVTLFGPTDHRWTTIPAPAGQVHLLSDPALPGDQTADEHPDRCRVDRITVEQVIDASDRLLGPARSAPAVGAANSAPRAPADRENPP